MRLELIPSKRDGDQVGEGGYHWALAQWILDHCFRLSFKVESFKRAFEKALHHFLWLKFILHLKSLESFQNRSLEFQKFTTMTTI